MRWIDFRPRSLEALEAISAPFLDVNYQADTVEYIKVLRASEGKKLVTEEAESEDDDDGLKDDSSSTSSEELLPDSLHVA